MGKTARYSTSLVIRSKEVALKQSPKSQFYWVYQLYAMDYMVTRKTQLSCCYWSQSGGNDTR